MKRLFEATLADGPTDRVTRSHREAILEMQALLILGATLTRDIQIPNNTDIVVRHRLGRAPVFVWLSPVRQANSAGIIREFRGTNPFTSAPIDATQVVCLRADGFGSTIIVDMVVF